MNRTHGVGFFIRRRNHQGVKFQSAQHDHLRGLSHPVFSQQAVQLVHVGDGDAVEIDDDVAFPNAGAIGGAAGLNLDDQHAAVGGEFVETDDPPMQRDVLAAEADVAALHAAEAENDMYHVRGYAMTRGYDAWIVYSGSRVQTHPPKTEVLIAARGADTVAPLPANE